MTALNVFLLISLIIFIIYLIIINTIAIHQTRRDKTLSEIPKDSPKYWRIPEFQLMLIAAMGGSFAMYLTMKKIHHKTRRPKFMVGIPVIMAVQVVLFAFIIWLRLWK